MKCNSVTPFLWLDDTARQAAEFYVQVFDDAEIVETVPGPGSEPIGVTVRVADLRFTVFNGGPHHKLTEAFSLMISVETQEEVDYFWSALSEGGQEDRCGWVKDRFGVSWQVVPEALMRVLGGDDPEGAARAQQAMLGMRKLDIAGLEAAYAGSGG